MICIFLVIGDRILAVELDPHKAIAKQRGRAMCWVSVRIFLTEQSGFTIRITDALVSWPW